MEERTKIAIVEPKVEGSKNTEDELDVRPFLDYLKSPQGHEIASRTLSIVEDLKKGTLEKSSSHAKFEKWLQAGIIVFVIIATSLLSFYGKFETSLGVLFGTMVGYAFGRK